MTHWNLKTPVISDCLLAEYMEADQPARLEIVRRCRYPRLTPQPHIKIAQFHIGAYLTGKSGRDEIAALAQTLKARPFAGGMDYSLAARNADCIIRFLNLVETGNLPSAESLRFADTDPVYIAGVKIAADIPLRVRTSSRSGRTQLGGIAFRFSTHQAYRREVARWHASFVHGLITQSLLEDWFVVGEKCCLALDLVTGEVVPAPADAASRYAEIREACAEIFSLWQTVTPPMPADDPAFWEGDAHFPSAETPLAPPDVTGPAIVSQGRRGVPPGIGHRTSSPAAHLQP